MWTKTNVNYSPVGNPITTFQFTTSTKKSLNILMIFKIAYGTEKFQITCVRHSRMKLKKSSNTPVSELGIALLF